ncbi:hypothetical protein EV424DRAFT_1349903 [Suillus variegatus]|nr:hypothetical protein EV424DRAFT_1349903 [Suillus variegatus]
MGSNLPSRKYSAFNTRFNPYAKASPRTLRSSEAHEIQELEWGIKASLKSYQLELQQREDDVGIWIGSDMDIDLPMSSASGTYGCVDTAMEDDELTKYKIRSLAVVPVKNIACGKSEGHQSPKRRRLVRGLQKTADKYIQRHFKTTDPRTDQVRKRVHIALQAALVCVDVDDMVLLLQRPDRPCDKRTPFTQNGTGYDIEGFKNDLQGSIPVSDTSPHLYSTRTSPIHGLYNGMTVTMYGHFVLLRGAGDFKVFFRVLFLVRHSHLKTPTMPSSSYLAKRA